MHVIPKPQHTAEHLRARRLSLFIAGAYALLGAAWIVVSDYSVFQHGEDGVLPVSITKGVGYVVVTAILLYFLVSRMFFALVDSERSALGALDGLSQQIAVLDAGGRILRTNAAWRSFATANDAVSTLVSEGVDYLAVCQRAAAAGDDTAARVADAIRDVAGGRRDHFALEYPCHSPEEQRWFVVRITRSVAPGAGRIIVSHEDVSPRQFALLARDEAEDRLHAAVSAARLGLWQHDMQHDVVQLSAQYCALLGLAAEPCTLGLAEWEKLVHPDDLHSLRTALQRLLDDGGAQLRLHYRMRTADGEYRWFLSQGNARRDEGGRVTQVRGGLVDVTERVVMEQALAHSTEYYRRLLDLSPDAVAHLDARGELRVGSTQLARVLRVASVNELLGRPALDFVHPRHRRRAMVEFLRTEPGAVRRGLHYTLVRTDGESFPAEVSAAAMAPEAGESAGTIMVVRDISEQREAEDRIWHLTHHDTLTGLPNRFLFMDRLSVALNQAARRGISLAVFVVEVGRLRMVNDSLGRDVGDAMLAACARRLRACLRASDTVSRPGGNEFLILLPEIRSPADAAELGAKLLAQFAAPVSADEYEVPVSVSIGAALFPQSGIDEETLLGHASEAVEMAMSSGSRRFRLYDPALDTHALERLTLERQLRQAIAGEELFLAYQPQVELAEGTVVGFEALARWQHPQHGLVPPVRFIPLAEETGLIGPLGRRLLRDACRQAVEWRRRGLCEVPVAVNISALQFNEADFVDGVRATLADTGLPAAGLELELTESVVMHGVESVVDKMRQLRAMGVRLALDDFGTGYSSMSYLRRFPLQCLKIDRSFVSDLPNERDAVSMARAIVGMGRSLGLQVLAEGIETTEQAEFLGSIWCERGQGFLYGRPQAAGDLDAWLVEQAAAGSVLTLPRRESSRLS